MTTTADSEGPNKSPSRTAFMLKVGVAIAFVIGIFVLTRWLGNERILTYLAEQETSAQAYRQAHPVLIYVLAFVLYVGVTGLSLPGGAILSILYGWFFDFLPAFLLVSFASTTGATIAFLSSRYFLRETILQRFGDRLKTFNAALEREGPWYLLTLRLLPVVPFFLINLVMGLTPLRAATFWWVSQVGMIPGTLVYIYAGNSIPDLATIERLVSEGGVSNVLRGMPDGFSPLNLLFALLLLAMLPVVIRVFLSRFRRSTTPVQ